jgi:hypothetical protein
MTKTIDPISENCVVQQIDLKTKLSSPGANPMTFEFTTILQLARAVFKVE